jgi:hypothetical protein
MDRRNQKDGRQRRHVPERRTAFLDRRTHQAPFRILFIPVGRLFTHFGTVTFF